MSSLEEYSKLGIPGCHIAGDTKLYERMIKMGISVRFMWGDQEEEYYSTGYVEWAVYIVFPVSDEELFKIKLLVD